jgi:hypothetical protein
MTNEELAKEITLALNRDGLIHHADYTKVFRLIWDRLDKAIGPAHGQAEQKAGK